MKNILKIIGVLLILVAGWYFISPLLITKTVNESLPNIPSEEEILSMSEEEKIELQSEIQNMYEDMEDVVMMEDVNQGDALDILKQGNFRDADRTHKGSGTAFLYKDFLRFEDFRVTNGPDLRVLLVENPNPQSSSDLGDYLELGSLKGNVGNQNYDIPNNIDISKYNSVVIYCKPFKVIFSVASLN